MLLSVLIFSSIKTQRAVNETIKILLSLLVAEKFEDYINFNIVRCHLIDLDNCALQEDVNR